MRERGKQRRRRRILQAAEGILKSEGIGQLRMRALAERAEVSSRTLYNLFGTKSDVLAALTLDVLEALDLELGPISGGDPIDRSRAVITRSIERFGAEAALFRPLLHEAYREAGGTSRAAVLARARRLQREAIEEAGQRRMLRATVAPDLLAHHVLGAYNHAAHGWSRGDLDLAGFRTQALHAWACLLLGVATPATAARLSNELDELTPAMERLIATSRHDDTDARRSA